MVRALLGVSTSGRPHDQDRVRDGFAVGRAHRRGVTLDAVPLMRDYVIAAVLGAVLAVVIIAALSVFM